MVLLPDIKGLRERVERIMREKNISVALKRHQTLRNILVHPKDKWEPKEGVYTIDCKTCSKKYVGETKILLAQRIKEHKKVEQLTEGHQFTREARKHSSEDISKSAVTDHARQLNHVIGWDSSEIVTREADRKL